MDKLDECSQLVSSVYDAALDFERWPIVLERLADALEGSTAVLRSGQGNTPGKWISVGRRGARTECPAKSTAAT